MQLRQAQFCLQVVVRCMYAPFPPGFKYNNCHGEIVKNFDSKQPHSTFCKTVQSYTVHLKSALCCLRVNPIVTTAA